MESAAWHPLIDSIWHVLFADRGLKIAMAAAGAMLIVVSGDEHFRRRVIGLVLTIGSHWCP